MNIDDRNIQEVLPLYFSGSKHALNFSKIEYGFANEHYKITFDHHESYFVKFYRYRNESMVSTELHLATTLKKFSILTPQVITTRSGYLYTIYQGHYLALFEFIESGHPKQTHNNLIKIGQLIAQIQQCSSRIALELNAYQVTPEALFRAVQALPAIEPSLAQFFHNAVSVTQNIPFDKLPKSLIHGDIFLDNLLETKESKLYVIDFEDAAFDNCLLDISRAIIGCCTKNEVLDMTLCQALLKGYLTQCSLTSIEQKYLYEYIIYAGLMSTFWRYKEFNIKRPHEGKNKIYKEWMIPTIKLINIGKKHFEQSI